MELTKEQKEKYIADGGLCCPVCHSSNIEGDSIDIDAGNAYQDITCLDCWEAWTDIYALRSIRLHSI